MHLHLTDKIHMALVVLEFGLPDFEQLEWA